MTIDEAVESFRQSKVVAGRAALNAGMSKVDFWAEVQKRGISLVDYDPAEIGDELKLLRE
ncbi:UPF0175 family protein [Noviherbaspirillum sp. L7-7A]|uniref:UPF0175 family protein n=1 Tax=Noviherbaspirillum sp. L7-7A TaxID=2850560 RepID=UPI001C2C964D|nr:UPF0175 family protein [Noviherbaspirillum sp. L7-7A]MBV0881579.1 UPF0175 family protein [Noviherbaspirillum sp. L7-7A]